jgi:hypothetical protein
MLHEIGCNAYLISPSTVIAGFFAVIVVIILFPPQVCKHPLRLLIYNQFTRNTT